MRTIRATLFAALAAAALAAAPAVASASPGVAAGEYPVTLNGTGALQAHVGSATRSCSGFGFSATLEQFSPTVTSSSVTNPSCTNASLKMNGCQVELDPAGAGAIGIGPAGCGPAELSVSGCGSALQIPAQNDVPAAYENVSGHVEVALDAGSKLEYNAPGNACTGYGTTTSVYLSGTIDVSAGDVGVTAITGGLSVGGGPEGPGQVEAAEYPVDIVGQRLEIEPASNKLVLLEKKGPQATVKCGSAVYDGGTLAGPAGTLTLSAQYSGCTLGTVATSVDMKSCYYVYSDLGYLEEIAYDADAEIVCDKEGDAITLVAGASYCTLTIPPQTLSGETVLGSIDVEDVASIAMSSSASGVEFTATGVICSLAGISPGTHENGLSQSDVWLKGDF